MSIRELSLALSALLLLGACDPFHTGFDDVEPAVMYRASRAPSSPPRPQQLRVMSYNIKFGGGRIKFFWECYGERGNMTRPEVKGNLERLAAAIRAIDPDVLVLQEVDVASKRCSFVDNLQYLLDHTALDYGAYASQWKADFIPSDGLGAMDSGNAILSRWPIREAERIALPLMSDTDALTRYFYLRRNILRARVELPGDPDLWLLATHLEAFDEDGTKKRQLDVLLREMGALDDAGELMVMAGDLNSVPPGTTRLSDYPDECDEARFAGDDYSEEVGWLDPLYARFTPAVSLADYQSDEERYFSFTNDEHGFWTRAIDYLFTNGTFSGGLVHQSVERGGVETLSLSDHAPVSVILELP